jgi:chromate reductase, NAD(P)H dehydrogenase (quinone)
MPKILAFAASTRTASFNRRALPHAVEGARATGMEVTVLDLRDFAMPIYNADLEDAEGLPAAAVALKQVFKEHHGLLLACPEYNSSITPLLKNTLDWVSRPHGEESGRVPYEGKIAALVSASASALGGLRGLRHGRDILTTLGVIVLPKQHSVSAADRMLPEVGEPDARQVANLAAVGRGLAEALARWHGAGR